jgi:phosphohistidine phosphatase
MAQRRLVVIRHAKADSLGSSDAERALAPRGTRDATAVGQWLQEATIAPDHAIVSPARRTRQTWALIAAELDRPPSPVFDERIYDNTLEDLVAAVGDAPPGVTTLALVGHNPGLHELALTLDDGRGDRHARQRLRADFPTSSVAVFDLDAAWTELAATGARLRDFATPRG